MALDSQKHPDLNSLCNLALEHKIFPRRQSLVYHFKDVFDNIKLENKRVLDIGGGSGILSFYSGVMGAKKTICLEPESDGSQSGMNSEFSQLKEKLRKDLPVEQLPLTLQDFLQKEDGDFDVVILNNSINHLNEDACIRLREDEESYAIYVDMFRQLYNKMQKGGQLIITDCSNDNFYHRIGMKSPFINGIEWHKHQHPKTWAKLLEKVGFSNPTITWSSPNRFGNMGRALLKNPVGAFFTSSHFRLVMEK